MKRLLVASMCVGVFLVTVATSAQQAASNRAAGAAAAPAPQAQAGGAPQLPPPTNLQFFPRTFTTQQILTAMQGFNAALGVGCGYCHVFDGPPVTNPKNDFAADSPEAKKKTRVMLALARDINAPSTRICESGTTAGRRTTSRTRHSSTPRPSRWRRTSSTMRWRSRS